LSDPGVPAATSAEEELLLGEGVPGVPIAEPGPVSGFVIFRTVLLLILAAVAVYGVVFVIKRFSRPRDSQNPHLRVLASARLGPNRFVHVVALGTRAWVVGSGEGGISPIADVTEQEALDTLFLEESRRNSVSQRPGDFQSLLRRLGFFRAPEEDSQGPGVDSIRRRRDRLRGL
jgi:flagellar protein FliO/FliZ